MENLRNAMVNLLIDLEDETVIISNTYVVRGFAIMIF